MEGKQLLKFLVLLMLAMFFANTAILKLHWYYSIWWIDMLMHFLGGLWVGVFFFYLFYTRKWFSNKILAIFLSVFLIGILWECFEFLANNYIGGEPFSVLDTTSDIFLDLAGGIVVVLYFFKKTMPVTLNKVQ